MNSSEFIQFLTDLGAYESGINPSQPQTESWMQYLQVFDPNKGNVDRNSVDISNSEDLKELQYHVHNTIGFLGKYQFGEALLIDLGYYIPADSGYYPSTSTNEWKGTWTGKHGVNSKEDFMSEIQETAIREAFAMNMGVIDTYLSQAGKTIEDFLGQEIGYTRLGEAEEATVTMSGILASAHLQGPTGVALLLLDNIATSDEYGTNILFYMDKFGGFDTPFGTTGDDFLVGSDYTETFIGKEGNNEYETGDGSDKIIIANNETGSDVIHDFDINKDVISLTNFPGVVAADLTIQQTHQDTVIEFPNGRTLTLKNIDADQVGAEQFVYGPYKVTWDANSGDRIIDNFNPEHDLIDLSYAFGSNQLALYEENGSSVLEILNNNQRIIIEGVALENLSSFHFIKAPADFAEVHFGANADNSPPADNSDNDGTVDPQPGGDDDGSGQQGTLNGDVFSYTWNWGARELINDFDVAEDQIDLKNFWTSFDSIDVYNNSSGDAVIDLLALNNQTITLAGVSADSLQDINFTGISGSLQLGEAEEPVDQGEDPVDEDPVDQEPVDETPDDEPVDEPEEEPVDETPPVVDSGDGAVYSFTWNWGKTTTVDHFDVQQDTIDLKNFWTSYDTFSIYDDILGNTVIDLSDLNNQKIILEGISTADLTGDNLQGVSGALNQAIVETNDDNGQQEGGDIPTVDAVVSHAIDGALVGSDEAKDVFNFTWNWGRDNVVEGFNPDQDVVDLTRFWTSEDQVNLYDNPEGNAVIDMNHLNNQTITLLGVSSNDLGDDNVVF